MKAIKLTDGIPSRNIQKLDDSMLEILKGVDKYNELRIHQITNEFDNDEEIKNKLTDEMFLAFKYTLANNHYGYLLSDDEMKYSVIGYVNKYILKKK